MSRVCVTVPTRNRPEKLERCLEALADARREIDFPVHVIDSSSDDSLRWEVAHTCSRFEFVELHRHEGETIASARNACLRAADRELIVTVDDDVYVLPDAITRLLDAYDSSSGLRVVAGSIGWGGQWSSGVVTRRIGYGRRALPGEEASFLLTGLLLYPRELGIAWPWHETVTRREDRIMGAVWRRHGVQQLHEPTARALHDGEPHGDELDSVESHFYACLFDSLVADRGAVATLGHQLLTFAAGAKRHFRGPVRTTRYTRLALRAYRNYRRDWPALAALCELPPAPALSWTEFADEPLAAYADSVV